MATKIQKWGNSLAVRLPKKIITRLNLKEGSEVVVDENQNQVIIQRVPGKVGNIKKNDWQRYTIPTANKKKERVSENIDAILYGKSC